MEKISTLQALEIFGEDAVPVLEEKLSSLEKDVELKTLVLEALNTLYQMGFVLFVKDCDVPLSKVDLVEPLYKAIKHKNLFVREKELAGLQRELKNIKFAHDHASGKVDKDILDVEQARRYPIENILTSKITGSGRVKQTKCPFHEEEHPSFCIYTNTNSFYCFSCKRGGDVISLVRELRGIRFKEAVRFLS